MAQLSGAPGVRSIEPAIYNTVLLSCGGRARGVVLKGVDPDLERQASGALRNIVAGAADFAPDADGIPALLVGRILADELKISAGDYVTLTSPQGNLTPFGMLPRSRRFRVTGIFDSGFYDYDANWGFVTLASAQGLAGVGDVVSLLEVRVAKLDDASAVADDLVRRAGPGLHGHDLDGRKPRALPRAEPGKTGDRAFHRADHFCRRAEYSGGADDDGDRARAGHRRADGHGRAAAADPPDFRLAGAGREHRRNGGGLGGGLRLLRGSRTGGG